MLAARSLETEQGESVIIARGGKPVAELVPARKARSPLGIARDEPIVARADECGSP